MKAIVTGHTKGLGEAIAAELLHRGIPVLGLARGLAASLADRYPGLLTQVEIDLSNTAHVSAWLHTKALHDYLGGCDKALLVNNAGVVSPVGPLHEQDPAAVIKAVSLNVAAPMALAAAVSHVVPRAQKRVLHISSGAGRSAYPGWSVYCATKAALDMHAQAVVLDGDKSVRICSLAPGVIDTGMQAEIRGTPEQNFPMRERFVQLKAAGQLATPQDTARGAVDYLLSPGFGDKPVADLRNIGA